MVVGSDLTVSTGLYQRTFAWSVVCCGTLLLLACDADKWAPPQSNQGQFELQKDPQGRTIRLNKITGEVVVVEGTQLIPVQRSEGTTTRTSQTSKPAARAPVVKPAAGGESATGGRAIVDKAVPEPISQTVVINVDSP